MAPRTFAGDESEPTTVKRGTALSLALRAADLARLASVEDVIRAVVRGTRELLGSDVAYLTTLDERTDEFYVRASEGFVSQAFLGLRSTVRGFGVYGLIIDTGRPFFSPDYAADSRFPHLPETDDAISTEGITALLGAPAPLPGHELPAVIFAGWRDGDRPRAEDDVALALAWGAVAGAALAEAMRREQLIELARRATVRGDALEQEAAALRRIARAQERLSAAATQPGTIDAVVEVLVQDLGEEVTVLEQGATTVWARVAQRTGTLQPTADVRAAMEESRRLGRAVLLPTGEQVAAIADASGVLGAVVRPPGSQPDDASTRILEHGARVIGALLLAEERVAVAERRTMGDVVTGLLKTPQDDMSVLAHLAGRYGVALGGSELGMAVADIDELAMGKALDRARQALSDERALVGIHDGRLVVIGPVVTRKIAGELRRIIGGDDRKVTVTFVEGSLTTAVLPLAFETAARCVRVLIALGRRGDVASQEDLAPYAAVFGEADAASLDEFITNAIGALLAHDAEKHGDLTQTLMSYLDHGLNIRETADSLFVHPNTIRQRLATISRLVPSFEDPARRFDLHLAGRLQALRVEVRP